MAKYAGKTSTNPTAYVADPSYTLYCSKCGEVVKDGDMVLDREIWKCGELDYIEVFHAVCHEPTADDAARTTAKRIAEDQSARDMKAESDKFLDEVFSSPYWTAYFAKLDAEDLEVQKAMIAELDEAELREADFEEPARYGIYSGDIDTSEYGWDL